VQNDDCHNIVANQLAEYALHCILQRGRNTAFGYKGLRRVLEYCIIQFQGLNPDLMKSNFFSVDVALAILHKRHTEQFYIDNFKGIDYDREP